MFRQITNVIQSQSVRRSPRLSQRFVPRHNAGDSNESLERSSLVTTYHHSRVTSSSNGQNVAVLNESGQRFPTNGATDAGSVTKQLFHEKKVTRHTTSYSSTTGQPYTGSPIEVGTESSEDSDVESTSQLSGCVQASNITPSTAERFRSAKSASFRPRRTDMPRHLFGLDNDDDEDIEIIKRQKFIHHKERILTPPRTITDTTDIAVPQNKFWLMIKKTFWRISSFFYLISTYLLYLDIEILRRFYWLVNPPFIFYQRISDIRQRSFGSFCYLVLLTAIAVGLVCLICGVSIGEDKVVDPGYKPSDVEIRAIVNEILLAEMPSQLDSLMKGDLLNIYFKSLITQEISVIQNSAVEKEISLNRALLDMYYNMSDSLNKRIEQLENQLTGNFIALITQLQHNVDRNLSWSEGNITESLTNQRQIELEAMNNAYQLIFQYQQDNLTQLKEENQNLLEKTKSELFDLLENRTLETDQKRELMAAKLKEVVNVTQKLDESVINLEKSLQELRNITDLLLKNGSSDITAVLQQMNNVTSEIVQLRNKFQEELSNMRQSQKSESDIEEKMAIVFRDELSKALIDGNSTLLVQLGKLFATATDIQDISQAMRVLNRTLENVTKLDEAKREVSSDSSTTTNMIDSNTTTNITEIEEMVKKLIMEKLDTYSADRLGKFDFALHSAGACVTDQKSPTFNPQSPNSTSYLEWLFAIKPRDANTILDPNVYPGQCWAFPGQKGYVVIKLAQDIETSEVEVAIEHLPKSLSPFGNISSAPENFTVSVSQTQVEWNIVGNYTYTGEKIIHEFPIQEEPKNLEFIRFVKFNFTSNHGKKEFTCIYRVRVHGKLYMRQEATTRENGKKSS